MDATYRLERELGGGGMSRVFVARDTALGRQVVVKVLAPELTAEVNSERFRREIHLAAQLQHAHIVPLLSAGEAAGLLYYTMPFVEGESLRARLERAGELPLADALRVLRDVARALVYAHRHGVVHRDIKPANILLTDDEALVADFGVAKAISVATNPEAATGGETVTTTGVVVGTPAYMSPEQGSADPVVDHRADIYAFGVVAYETLAGQHPFGGRTPQAMRAAHATQSPEPLSRRRPGLPIGLEDLVMRCLEKRPADRPQSAEELVRALGAVTIVLDRGSIPPARKVRLRRAALLPLGLGAAGLAALLYLGDEGPSGKQPGPVPDTSLTSKAGPSVAVIPFVNLSGHPDNEYFSDGLTEEIANALAQIPGLRVAARTSAFQFKGQDLDVREIGRRLNVANLIEGSVRRDQDRLRVTVQLVSTADGYHRWSEAYDRQMEDVFAVQQEIARAIAGALRLEFGGGVTFTRSQPASVDLEAYDLYLRGRYFWNLRTSEGLKKAEEFFQQAVRKDPRFARAYAGLADAYVLVPAYDEVPPAPFYSRARAAALRALALDSSLAEAHTSLADVKALGEWDWSGAEAGFQRAIELNPNYVTAYYWYTEDCLNPLGREEEAFRAIRLALQLEPLSPQANRVLGIRLYLSGRYDEAVAHLRSTADLYPGQSRIPKRIAQVYLAQAKYSEAIAVLRPTADSSRSWTLWQLGYAYAKSGQRVDAERIAAVLEGRAATDYVPGTHIALVHLALDDKDRAFQWLERAVEAHDPYLIVESFPTDPLFAPLRADPRGKALLRRMRL